MKKAGAPVPHWGTRPFAELVNELWAAAEGRRRARYTTLHRRITEGDLKIGYEGFRLMCDGRLTPRVDVMEEVAAALAIDPREFPEYRLQQLKDAFSAHPELTQVYYDEVMAYAATLEHGVAKEE